MLITPIKLFKNEQIIFDLLVNPSVDIAPQHLVNLTFGQTLDKEALFTQT